MPNLQGEFVQFIQMLLDDEEMQKWFMSLSSLSENGRTIELRNLMFKLSESKGNENIIRAVASLSDDDAYDSVRAVLLAELNQRMG